MVSVLTSSAIDRIKPETTQLVFVVSPPSTQHVLLLHQAHSICCFSTKNTALKRKGKVWLAQNQANVSERGDMAYRELLFQ